MEHLKKVGGNHRQLDYRVHGRRKRETVCGSQTLAKESLNKRLTEISEETWLDRKRLQRVTIGELAQRYCDTISARKQGGTREGYCLGNLVRQFSGRTLGEFSQETVERWHAERGKAAPVNADRELALLRHMFYCAVEWKMVREHPARGIRLFKRENRRLRYLTREQIEQVLKSLRGVVRLVVLAALHTGMRRGELLALQWTDIDWLSGSIHVRKSKNGEDRFVPMDSVLVDLRTWHRFKRSQFVFTWPNGLCVQDVRESFQSALRKCKIADFRFHDLRHTFASHYMMNGGDLNRLRETLGHKTILMTQRYAHLSRAYTHEAVKVMDSFGTLSAASRPQAVQPASVIILI